MSATNSYAGTNAFSCCTDARRAAVLNNPTLNGIDYLEVLGNAAPSGSPPQQTLLVHCLKPAPTTLTTSNIVIDGGESVTGIFAVWVGTAAAPPPQAIPAEVAYFTALPNAANILIIRTNVYGDFSPYTLRLVNNASAASTDPFMVTEAIASFDPQLAAVTFSFKVECGPAFDCAPPATDCPPELPPPPPINYLAKDYGSFRTILLDRLNQLLPSWNAASEADIGVMLAELIAYIGDNLSYQQDAIATEAYLLTARSRISLRRHALLVDYHVHDGCNARVWVQLNVASQIFLDRTKTRFYTYAPGMPSSLAVGSGNEEDALIAGVVAFEPMQDAMLFPELNQMQFYTWGDSNCCLPQGATEATLLNNYPNLQVGDVLIFQEMMGPQTGFAADADLRHRCAVRLTQVAIVDGQGEPLVDPLFENLTGKPITSSTQKPTPVTEIQWSVDDALPFPVCISSTYLNSDGDEVQLSNVSVVFGNVVLADQGLSLENIALGTVPSPTRFVPANPANDRCNPTRPTALPVRFRPQVPDSPLTQAVALPLAGPPNTPNAVALPLTGWLSLSDSNGFTCLMLQADNPAAWPQYFGVSVVSGTVSGTIDLSVVFAPPGGPAGLTAPAVLETFTGLSFDPGPNFVATQINSLSRLISVPTGYTPPATPPTQFPPDTPVMLKNSATITLEDLLNDPYLTLQPTKPTSWPPLFAIVAQSQQQDPTLFNLLLLYAPSSGGVGVATPVIVERFKSVSLANISAVIDGGSTLLSVRSFEEQPNPSLSACDLMNYNASDAVPEITLTGVPDSEPTPWTAMQDLLGSSPTDKNFVVEVESTGVATLRFGDGTNGLAPVPGTAFTASYRIGNGTAGNVGAGSLANFAADVAVSGEISSTTNPMPAGGGVDPETNAQIQRRAPQAFMTQQRAITMNDYINAAEQNSQVEDAAATLRWTGSWYTVFVTAEPQTAGNLSSSLQKSLTKALNAYRLAGQDIQLQSPQYIALEIALTVCVDPAYFALDVQQSLMQILGSGTLPNGQPALFAPGNFVLGQTVYLSPIYAAARSVAGVQSVTATVFQPQGVQTSTFLNNGAIKLGPFQVARMDNDPSLPGNGQLTLNMLGGK